MRIAVVCPYDLGLWGGVQNQAVELVTRLRAAGEDAWLVGPNASPELGIDVGSTVVLPANRSRVPMALGPGVRRRVAGAVLGAEVVHVHEPFVPRVSTSALTAGPPVVATFHAAPPRWVTALYRGGAALGNRLMRNARVLTAVSPVAAAALPVIWAPITLIPNGIDVAAYAPAVERVTNRAVFVGRDEPRKGLEVGLRAWSEVIATRPDAELLVIGVDREDAPPGVRFVGRVSERDKRNLLASAAVHVAPNLGGESFGIVVAEGMAAGCAVVCSDLPAFRAVGADAVRFATPGDASTLATTLLGLLSDPAEVERMGMRGRERAREFDWSVVLDRYLAAYAQAVMIF